MKKRSKKEKPNPKRPQLWYQEGGGPNQGPPRVRIVYPNGLVEFMSTEVGPFVFFEPVFRTSCFVEDSYKNQRGAMLRMRAYDNAVDFKPAMFLGNI